MRFPVFIFLAILAGHICRAQQSKYNAFTVNDGLPSNYVYRAIEDNKGFMWVATDAGIARFDGKHFQVFTTRDGLPDNEVLAVVKENSGRIWVNCFKQKPAYFDEIKNRFVNATEDSSLAKITEGTSVMLFFPLQDGGIMFYNELGSFIYKDKKLTEYKDGFFIKKNEDGSRLRYEEGAVDPVTKRSQLIISRVKGDTRLESAGIQTTATGRSLLFGTNDGKFYLFKTSEGKCFIYSEFKLNPLRFRVDSVTIPESFNNFEFTYDCFYLLGSSNKIYLFNKKTLQREAVINGNYLGNSVYKDNKGNLWVCTIDKGLLVYNKTQFGTVKMPGGFTHTNFLSIARRPDGTLLAGNFYGEVLESRGNKVSIHTIPKEALIARVRKIIISQNKVFTFSETGIHVNYAKKLTSAGKTAVAYNDSVIIIGMSTSLQKLNTITEQLSRLKSQKRITAVTRSADGNIYYGSTDGLYKLKKVNKSPGASDPLLPDRATSLCGTPDNLVWVATSGNGVVILQNDRPLLHISEKEGIINNATRSITTTRPGQVWVGTVGGISVINYTLHDKKIAYTIQNLSVNDGLVNNMVNEMFYQKDSVYAATGNGISVIPANISIPKFNIPVQLIRISVNQRDTIISSNYRLGYNERNIQMEFAGIELSGHFKKLQYTLDKNKDWSSLDENILAVQLNSGNHTVQVRAVDVNGNISNKILTVKFDIAAPFWKTIWFWMAAALMIQFVTIFLVNRRQKSRREAKLAKEIAGVQLASLEQQAFTSLMNPHFMFNALNSIQHYINVQDRQNANRYLSDFASLIRKNFEAAQQSFIPLEQELENIKIYMRLEQMRFNDRFSYRVVVDENLEPDDWMIPTMVLQPLLENALLHGIMPSAVKGKIVIELKDLENNLLIVITDNGIGIDNSLALKDVNGHKSRGMELIKKRIAALSRFGQRAVTISMSQAFDSRKNPGNRIHLLIPAELHRAWMQAQDQ